MSARTRRPEPLAALGHRALAVAPELYALLRFTGSREVASRNRDQKYIGPRIHRATWRPLPAS